MNRPHCQEPFQQIYKKTPLLRQCRQFKPAQPRCPLWGKCRNSGKGGAVGSFELLPFNQRHPLCDSLRAAWRRLLACMAPAGAQVSPYGLPAPPLGGQGIHQTSPERGGGATAPEGSGAVRRIPIGMHQGEFVQSQTGHGTNSPWIL